MLWFVGKFWRPLGRVAGKLLKGLVSYLPVACISLAAAILLV